MPEANKIILNGQTLIDLTQDTATAADVAQGKTFHNAAGVSTTGSYVNPLVGVLDGSATSITVSDYGVTSLAPYRFYQFTNLQNLDLTGVTNIPAYFAYQCSNLTSLTLGQNITNIGDNAFYHNYSATINELNGNNCVIGSSSLAGVPIVSLTGSFSAIGSSAFNGNLALTTVDIKINGALQSGETFRGCKNVSSFTLDPTSNITEMAISNGFTFYYFGKDRANPESNIFKFDFRNSTFTYGGGRSSFEGTTYMDIYFPSTMTTLSLSNDMFYGSSHLNIFYKSIPAVRTDAFGQTNNCATIKNFFPYNLAQTAKTSTNWSSSTNGIVNSIYGYAEENTFSQGATLPATDANGYELTWYSDAALTNQVATVTDPTQIYYCAVGAKVATPLTIAEYQANVTVSDGTNTYVSGQCVPYNSTITITAIGEGANTTPYIFTFNGTTISSGDTYTVTSSDTLLDIQCMYYDGVNPPIDSTFANNSWNQIAAAVKFGLHRTLWPISSGSTVSKPVTLKDGTAMSIRLADSTANRYQYSDGSGYSQAVLEMDACIATKYYMNSSNTNSGGWPATYMCNTVMSTVYNDLLPDDLKAIIRQVKKGSSTSGLSSALTYADNYCFLPSASEIYTSYSSYSYDEGAIYEYYYGTSDNIKIKRLNYTAARWWLASPQRSNSSQFIYVYDSGSYSYGPASNTNGVSVCVAI